MYKIHLIEKKIKKDTALQFFFKIVNYFDNSKTLKL